MNNTTDRKGALAFGDHFCNSCGKSTLPVSRDTLTRGFLCSPCTLLWHAQAHFNLHGRSASLNAHLLTEAS